MSVPLAMSLPPSSALQGLLESMVDAAENLCPSVMKKAHIRQDLIHASTEKISIPRTFVKNVLLEQSGIDILNKIRYVHCVTKLKELQGVRHSLGCGKDNSVGDFIIKEECVEMCLTD